MPTVPIAPDHVLGLPRCRGGRSADALGGSGWARSAQSRWGACGLALRDGGDTVGYALMARGAHAGDLPGWHTTTVSQSCAVLVALWVARSAGVRDVPRVLVDGLIARLSLAGDTHLLARGSWVRPTCTRPNVPQLRHCGFELVSGPLPRPLLSVDISAAVKVAPREPGWRGMLSALRRPDLPPAPAQRLHDAPGLTVD